MGRASRPPPATVGATRWVALFFVAPTAGRERPPAENLTGGAGVPARQRLPAIAARLRPARAARSCTLKPPTLLILDLQLHKKMLIFMMRSLCAHSFGIFCQARN